MAIDATVDPYVLLGRVVTMRDAEVIDDGAVYIQAGEIVDVGPESDSPPAGFEDAEEIRTGGTIYPGLIELHNHLSYNAIPLWQVSREYMHSGHWQGADEYRHNVTKPVAVLANTAGAAEAMVRFAECRCLLGGVTTSQGVTLQANSGVRRLYRGIVRNVESPTASGLARAHPRIGAPDKDREVYLAKLDREQCYLQHLSEGINDGKFDTAVKQFTGLQRDDDTWAVTASLSGVHSTALRPEHMTVLADHGASLVWSPLSNYLLYGATTDVATAKQAGVPIALGSDWAPSGTKNLLGEIKVAKVVSDEQNGLFTLRELCEMVTTTPAEILGWQDRLGRIEAGKLADLVVLHGATGDPYDKLVSARETSVTFVIIHGVPRVGQTRMMTAFGPGTETTAVGRSKRVLNLTPLPGDEDLGGITLGAATTKLSDTLENLPARAEDLDNALATGWIPGVELATSGISANTMPGGFVEPPLRVVLEFEEEDSSEGFFASLQAGNLADWVVPMELEGITVVDDRDFLHRLVRARNLPRFVKERLPALHGQRVAIPVASGLAPEGTAGLGSSIELRSFLSEETALSDEERRGIIDQAILLLERYYVHLPMKRNMHAVDPVQRLRNLRHEIDQGGGHERTDLDFHREIVAVFDSLRDLHTAYRLPRPFRGKVAWLPFSIEEYRDRKRGEPVGPPRFLVSKVVGNVGPKSFKKGVEVLYWNGVPIARAVARLAAQMPGGNAAARRARAMNSLTLRSLTRGQLPDEHWVTLRYRTATRKPRTTQCTHAWKVFTPGRGRRNLTPEQLGQVEAAGLGLDDHTDDLQQAKKAMFAAKHVKAEEDLEVDAPLAEVVSDEIPTALPTVFRARRHEAEGTPYGYLRIFTFNVDDADEFVDEMERLLAELPEAGLIIDVRGNGGGLIHAAERALELLSPRPIEPEPAQFINTPATLTLCQRHEYSTRLPGLELQPWLNSLRRSGASGAKHSLGFPITPREDCNRKGQAYQGPKVLIVDGLCYSAADMFIAGFQDHGLGEIISLHGNTGAGGANVWSHRLLRFLTADERGGSDLRFLPHGADLRVAVRRTLRVGPNAGEIVEDFGIKPQHEYAMTRADLLDKNRDLIRTAIGVLQGMPTHRLTVKRKGARLVVSAPGADWVEVTVPGRTVISYDLSRAGRAEIDLGGLGVRDGEVEVVGHADGRPVARVRHPVSAD